MSEQHLAPSELRYMLLALSREWERAVLDQEKTHALTSAQVEILLVLNESGARSMQELGQILLLNRDPFRSVDSLVAKGLVERGSGTDKRKVLWSLTANGMSVADSIVAADFALLNKFVGPHAAEDTSLLVRLLREVQKTVSPTSVLEERFATQRTPVKQLLAASTTSQIQENRSERVAQRLRKVIQVKDDGDLRQAYVKYGPSMAERKMKVGLKAWTALIENGGPASPYFLNNLSEVVTGSSEYLLTDDEQTVREVENRIRAEKALSFAGVNGFGGSGTPDEGALHALAELVHKRLGTAEKD